MPRRYINELTQQESIDEVFVANDKQLRPNRAGNLYLQVELSDRSGSITARIWNANDAIYRSFENGDYVHVTGTAQLFQGAMQIIATKLHRVDPADVDEADFAPLPAVAVDKLVLRLGEILRSLGDPPLHTLAECYLMDEPFMAKLMMAPAGTKNHHAYHGGLLEHIVGLMELVLRVAPCYPQINCDMLLMGAFLHDLGKTDELSYQHGLAYTDEGQLIGHLVMAVELLNAKIAEAEKLSGEPIPHETVLRLKHIILSHHGEYAFGSPKLPMTLEAIALAMLDNLDAKINTFSTLMNEDPNVDSPWTTYNPNLERKLYKGRGERGERRGERGERREEKNGGGKRGGRGVKCVDSATPCCRAAILFPIAWALFLLLAFPAMQVLFVGFRVAISIITILAFIVLAKSLKGWRHVLALPVWLFLLLALYATWAHPIWTQADWDRARREEQEQEMLRHTITKQYILPQRETRTHENA